MCDTTGHPKARPLRADARRNREVVLATAQEMLSTDGASVPFDEIARRAGVGVGTVYRHFPTRDALLGAVLHDRIEGFVQRAQGLLAADTDPGTAFLDYFAHLVDEVAVNQALCDALQAKHSEGFAVPDRLRTQFRDAFDALLRRAQAAGAVRSDMDGTDALDLLLGTVTAEQRSRHRGTGGRPLAVTLAGLRAAPR